MTDHDEYENGDPDSYAEPEPAGAPEPEQDPGRYQAIRRLYVRQEGSQDAPALRILEIDQRVTVTAIEDGWAQLDDGGHVKAEYLQPEDES